MCSGKFFTHFEGGRFLFIGVTHELHVLLKRFLHAWNAYEISFVMMVQWFQLDNILTCQTKDPIRDAVKELNRIVNLTIATMLCVGWDHYCFGEYWLHCEERIWNGCINNHNVAQFPNQLKMQRLIWDEAQCLIENTLVLTHVLCTPSLKRSVYIPFFENDSPQKARCLSLILPQTIRGLCAQYLLSGTRALQWNKVVFLGWQFSQNKLIWKFKK